MRHETESKWFEASSSHHGSKRRSDAAIGALKANSLWEVLNAADACDIAIFADYVG